MIYLIHAGDIVYGYCNDEWDAESIVKMANEGRPKSSVLYEYREVGPMKANMERLYTEIESYD